MTNIYFLKKIYEEYKNKNINDLVYLEQCIKNYSTKEINLEFLFFCYVNNVLLEMLYNINLSYTYISNFNSLQIPSETKLPYFNYKTEDILTQRNEKRDFWNSLISSFYVKYENCMNISDNYILDMLVCDIQQKSFLIQDKNYQQLINDLEKIVDNSFFNKNVIYFLLLKDLLLEYFLNLLICYPNNSNNNNLTQIDNLFTPINSSNIKYPVNSDQLTVLWFNLNQEFAQFKTNKITHFFNH